MLFLAHIYTVFVFAQLQDRVEMLGEVAHDNVRNVLVRHNERLLSSVVVFRLMTNVV